jgi:3-oxoacyl-[acyl-carrier protein] reductase
MKRRTVFITGGSRGIGNAVLEKLRFLDRYDIIAPAREELDLAKDESLERFLRIYREKPIDAIVNNAGINTPQLVDELSDKNIRDTIQVNLVAPIKLIRGIVGHMKQNRYGKIVNISSVFGIVSKEKRALYSATKFGLNGVTKALAVELGPYNILVNSVCPGYTNTELTKRNVSEAEKEKIIKHIPLRRFAEPAEIANLIAFLISDENTYITGQIISADGGFTSQ